MSQTSSQTRLRATVLADQIFAGESLLHDAIRVVVANILLILCAHIIVPLPRTPVPITGQTFGVLLIAALLGSRRSALVMLMYLAEGISGLPVFAPIGLPGVFHFFGPTAGYLLSYPVVAFLLGWLVERGAGRTLFRLLGALILGGAIILASGCAWLAVAMHLGWTRAFFAGVAPFLPGDALKTVLVLAAVRGIGLARREPRA
ncbi:MAG TPA: biotin transporter BioY [Candidatus Acidoferrales bacterium]|nr:biotin transporter BioY [Candidatus Acidoferrales bacterium]